MQKWEKWRLPFSPLSLASFLFTVWTECYGMPTVFWKALHVCLRAVGSNRRLALPDFWSVHWEGIQKTNGKGSVSCMSRRKALLIFFSDV